MKDMKTNGTMSTGQLIEILDFYDNKYYDPEFGLIEANTHMGKLHHF